MRRSKIRMSTQELGLIIAAHLLPSGDLHYGYWEPGLEVNWNNLSRAQQNFSEFLASHIPAGVKSILDIGTGTGKLTEHLVEKGYQVDGVSPSKYLVDLARTRLGSKAEIMQYPFEDFETERRYQLGLFSESFQYIPMESSLPKAHSMLEDGGHVLIADFFKTETQGRSPIGGGHRLSRFYEVLAGQPFELVEDLDITPQTAPTIELIGRALVDYGLPIHDAMTQFIRTNHPWFARVAGWFFRRKIERNRFKLFSGRLNGAAFSKFRSYRLILLRKK